MQRKDVPIKNYSRQFKLLQGVKCGFFKVFCGCSEDFRQLLHKWDCSRTLRRRAVNRNSLEPVISAGDSAREDFASAEARRGLSGRPLHSFGGTCLLYIPSASAGGRRLLLYGGTDAYGRREDSVSLLTDPNQSLRNKVPQDFVLLTSMRARLKGNHPTRSQKGSRDEIPCGVEGQRPSPSETVALLTIHEGKKRSAPSERPLKVGEITWRYPG